MTDKKVILNDGQYSLNVLTGEISILNAVLTEKGYYKTDNKNSFVKKVCLDLKDADWFEKHHKLHFYDYESDGNYLSALNEHVESEYGHSEAKRFVVKALIKAYFCGYYTKE